MSEPLTLKIHDTPTYFNKEALIGSLVAFPIGTVVGAIMGKNRMEREKEQGRLITEPTMANSDAVLGGLLGSWVGAIAGAAVAVALGAAVILSPEIVATVGAKAAMIEAAQIVAGLGSMAGLIGGALIGGYSGKQDMQQDMVKAQIERAVEQDRDNARARGHEHHMEHEHGHGKQHAASIVAERERSASQGNYIG